MKKYHPVDCGFHSKFELAIMHKKRLSISLRDNENTVNQTIKPIDLVARNHEEFLIVEDEKGKSCEIRLDHIIDILP